MNSCLDHMSHPSSNLHFIFDSILQVIYPFRLVKEQFVAASILHVWFTFLFWLNPTFCSWYSVNLYSFFSPSIPCLNPLVLIIESEKLKNPQLFSWIPSGLCKSPVMVKSLLILGVFSNKSWELPIFHMFFPCFPRDFSIFPMYFPYFLGPGGPVGLVHGVHGHGAHGAHHAHHALHVRPAAHLAPAQVDLTSRLW